MGKMLQRYVSDAFRDQPISSLRERLTAIAPSASNAQRIELGMLPMLLPDLERVLQRLIVSVKDDDAARGFAGGLLSYIYNPLDILPDDDGPIGLLDDTFVCAVGLMKLAERSTFVHDEFTRGICELVTSLLPALDAGLRDSIERFVADLLQATSRQIALGVFAPGVSASPQ